MVSYSLKHISGPATEPVTLAEVKLQARLDPADTSEDALLAQYIASARRDAENVLGKKIGTQTWDIVLDEFPSAVAYFPIPLEPLISVDEIEYTDEEGEVSLVDTTTFSHSAPRCLLWLKPSESWPAVTLAPYGGVRIRVTVGMQSQSDGGSPETMQYPANIRQAILLRAATYYRFREDTTAGAALSANEVRAFQSLLGAERVIAV